MALDESKENKINLSSKTADVSPSGETDGQEYKKYKIPREVLDILDTFESAGFDAFLVGGCVRDLLLGRTPNDWDVTTDAKPEEIQKNFKDTFYENEFGTVGIVTGSDDETTKVVEVTPYRKESRYTDKRHPDVVVFADELKDDLSRRDFTINAMAIRVSQAAFTYSSGNKRKSSKQTEEVGESFMEVIDLADEEKKLVDFCGGRKDLKKKIIRTVGDPNERFNEDALRMLRAVRLMAELNFTINMETKGAITANANLLRMISKERIRDEFNKIIMSKNPSLGVTYLQALGLLKYIVPELEEGIGVLQNKEHIFGVWIHNLRTLKHSADKGFSLEIRLAALFHDIAKPRTKQGEGFDSTFYNHEVVGARMTAEILTRLKYPKKVIEKVTRLVRWHLFFSDTEVITLSAVRRMIRNVGTDSIWDLINVRFCDRVGMGRPKEEPYRLRKYEAMIEEALRDPLSVSQLKVSGEDVMKIAGIEAGPKVGHILHALLEEVLDDPKLNEEKYLTKRVRELAKLPDEELENLGKEGKKKKEEKEAGEVGEIRKKYGVR